MKMTTKMLAVAVMAVMAFAAFAAVGFASDDDAETGVGGDAYYTVYIDENQFDGDGAIDYDLENKVFEITGTLIYDGVTDSWPLTVKVANSLWYQQSLTYIVVNGVSYHLTEDVSEEYCYFLYELEIVWDETKNVASLVIKDNSPVTKTLDFDMTEVDLQKYVADDSSTYTDIDKALDAATDYITVTKLYKPSYNYGTAVKFEPGFNLVSKVYNLEIVDYAIIGGVEYFTKYTLMDVQTSDAYVVYKAFDGTETKYILQKWNLAPIQIASITPSKNVEYNGEEQTPTIVVTDINGTVVKAENYTVVYTDVASVTGTPQNAGLYRITLAPQQNNFDPTGVYAEWTITPYDLSKGERIKLVGAEGLVYNAKAQNVTIVLDDATAALFNLTGNDYTITTTWKQVAPKELVPVGYIEGTDSVSDLTVSGIVAATHTIYFATTDNFTSGIEGQPITTFVWNIAQKSIVGSTLVWVGDGFDLMLKGSINYIDGQDYLLKYVSNDGQRVIDAEDFDFEDPPYGTWYGMAYGVYNYTGVVMTDVSRTVGADAPVITIKDVVKTDQGKSIRVTFSPAIDVDVVEDAVLYVNYTTVEVVNGKHMNASGQIVMDLVDPDDIDDVATAYVSFDAIFTYADVTLRYGYGPEPYAYDITNTVELDIGSKAWSEKSLLTIVDVYGNYVDNARLKVDSNVYENGALIPSGLQTATPSEFGVLYQDKNGDTKRFDLVNYSVLADGMVLFDGEMFVVKDLGVPTAKVSVGADKINGAVGEVIKLTVTDEVDANFTPKVTVSVKSPAVLDGDPMCSKYIIVDTKNWTVTSTISSEFTVSFKFLNGVTYEKTFKFGNGGAALDVAGEYEGNVTTMMLYTINYDDGMPILDAGVSDAAYEGEEVKVVFETSDDTIKSVTVTDEKGNEIHAAVNYDKAEEEYSVIFKMPSSAVTVKIVTA